jgi:hypothetical protein
MGITNFVSRPFAGLATIITEYTDNPLKFIIGFAISSLFVIKNVKEQDDQNREINPAKISAIDYSTRLKRRSSVELI